MNERRSGTPRAGEPPGDGEMNEMSQPPDTGCENSCPSGLQPSTLPLGHGGSDKYSSFTSERFATARLQYDN